MESNLTLENNALFDSNSKKVFLPKKCMTQIIKAIPQIKGEIKLKYTDNSLFKDTKKIEMDKQCLKNLERKMKLVKEREIKEKAKQAKKAIKSVSKGAPLPKASTTVSTGTSLTEITKAQEAIRAQQEKEKKEKEETEEIEGKIEIIKKQISSQEIKDDLEEITKLLKNMSRLRTIDTTKRNKILSYLGEFARSPIIFLDNTDKKKALLTLLQETGLSNITSLDQKLNTEGYIPKNKQEFIQAYKLGYEVKQLYITIPALKILKQLIEQLQTDLRGIENIEEPLRNKFRQLQTLLSFNIKSSSKFVNQEYATIKIGNFDYKVKDTGAFLTKQGNPTSYFKDIKQIIDEATIENEPISFSGVDNYADLPIEKKYQLHLIQLIYQNAQEEATNIEQQLIQIQPQIEDIRKELIYYNQILEANK